MKEKNHRQKIKLGNVHGWKWKVVGKAWTKQVDASSALCSFCFSSHPFPVEPQHLFVVYRMELGLASEPEETAGAEGSELKTRMEGHDTGQNGAPAGLSWGIGKAHSYSTKGLGGGGGGGSMGVWSRQWGAHVLRTQVESTSCRVYKGSLWCPIAESFGRLLESMFEAKHSDWMSEQDSSV